MSVQLLDKTRKINKLLHNNNSSKVVFNDICEVLSEILESNVLVISKKGKVLGISITPNVEEIKELIDDEVGGHIDELLNERFLGVLSTKENVNLETLGFESGDVKKYQANGSLIFATAPVLWKRKIIAQEDEDGTICIYQSFYKRAAHRQADHGIKTI